MSTNIGIANASQHFSQVWIAARSELARRTRAVKHVELITVAVLAAFTAIVFIAIGANFLWMSSITFSAVGGFVICYVLMSYPALYCAFQKTLCEWLGIKKDAPRTKEISDSDSKERSHKEVGCRMPPWATLRLSHRLNDSLEEFFETLVDNYINNWYKADISSDDSFVLEIRHQIRHAAAIIASKLRELDAVGLFMDELLPMIVAHVERVGRLSKSRHPTDRSGLTALETQVLDSFDDLHWAMCADDGEQDYLRVIADALVAHCVDATQIGGRAVDADLRFSVGQPTAGANFRLWWPSHSCRHFLRELLLHTALRPALDFIADPDMLNRLLLIALDAAANEENPAEELAKSDETEFLGRLTDFNQHHAPDSLLSLKLNDLVREPRLIQLLDMYLRDIQGPTHMLDCFLQARDVHRRIQAYRMEGTNHNPEDETRIRERKMILSEIESDAWQLFSAFVHESAPNRIDFSPAVQAEFTEAATGGTNDAALLERATEDVYKELYQKLHYDYVIPFCQSESYLGYLCGAPPDVEELIRPRGLARSTDGDARTSTTAGSRPSTPASAFSITQFRNKLFSVLGGGASTKGIPLDDAKEESALAFGSASKLQSDTDDLETGEIALVDLSRDLNKWTISIPSIECRRELVSSKSYFVYAIEVHRNDLGDVGGLPELYGARRSTSRLSAQDKTRSLPSAAISSSQIATAPTMRKGDSLGAAGRVHEAATLLSPTEAAVMANEVGEEVQVNFHVDEDEEEEEDVGEILPMTWTTYRKYEEFFQLEEKVREFHGNSLRMANLPDRKAFLSTRNRSLMEAHRPLFERFLQTLTQQLILKRSELLYDFLTLSEDDWSADMALAASMGSNFMPDLRNPLRAMRRMPTKLARERGQNLKPFILNVLANILVPRSAVYSTTSKYVLPHEEEVIASSAPSTCRPNSGGPISQKSTSSLSLTQLSGGMNSTQLLGESASSRASPASHRRSTNSLEEEMPQQRNAAPSSSSASPSPIPDSISVDDLNLGENSSMPNTCTSCLRRSEQSQVNGEMPPSRLSSLVIDCDVCGSATDQHFIGPSEFISLNYYFNNTGLGGLLTFVALRVLRISRWFEAILVAFLRLFQPIFEPLARRFMRRFCAERVLCEQSLLALIDALRRVIFDTNEPSTHVASEEEKRLRSDLTIHRLEEAILTRLSDVAPLLVRLAAPMSGNASDIRTALRSVFNAFQMARLNRQLVFVLIDRVARQFMVGDENEDNGNGEDGSQIKPSDSKTAK